MPSHLGLSQPCVWCGCSVSLPSGLKQLLSSSLSPPAVISKAAPADPFLIGTCLRWLASSSVTLCLGLSWVSYLVHWSLLASFHVTTPIP